MSSWLKILAGVSMAALIVVYGGRFLGGSKKTIAPEKLVQQAVMEPVSEKVTEQQQAIATLLKLPEEVRREPLRQVIHESKAPAPVVAAATLGLASGWDYDSMPRMLDLLDDPAPEVRAAACSSVRKLMSIDYGFKANDPPEKREAAAKQLREHWAVFRDSDRLARWKVRLKSGQLDGSWAKEGKSLEEK